MFQAAVGLLVLGVIVFSIGMKAASRIAAEQSRVLSRPIKSGNINQGVDNSLNDPNAMAMASVGQQGSQTGATLSQPNRR
jgi:hypothetical protein